MSGKINNKAMAQIIPLAENPDFQFAHTDIEVLAQDDRDPVVALECLFGNPRFTMPANDEVARSVAYERPAPSNRDARQARLVRMWFEEVAEAEKSRR